MPTPPPRVSARPTEDVDNGCVKVRAPCGMPGMPTPSDGRFSVMSAVCLIEATPPPATKNGSSRAAVVGMTTRTLFDQIATRPPSFDRLNKGNVEMGGKVAKTSTTVVRSMRSLFGYGAL